MRGRVLFAVAVAMAVGLPWSAARACGGGGNGYNYNYTGLAIAVLAIGAADVAMTVYDGGAAVAASHPSVSYGVLETMVAAPQLALGLYGLSQAPRNTSTTWMVYTAWTGLLMAHGIWTIATTPSETPRALEVRESSSALQRRAPEPVLQVGIGPTYVPLGPRSQPGLGLVGRF